MHSFLEFFKHLLLAYGSGLLAAVSPCVIVLVPLVLFRFMRKPEPGQASQNVRLGMFCLGFQSSYLIFGYVLSSVLTSSIQNGFKLGLGGLFMSTSFLALMDQLDPLSMPLFKNTFAMGISFALLLSFNPCTVPFLAVLISLESHHALISLFFFGTGLLTPSVICVLMGKKVLTSISKTSGSWMHKLNKCMAAILGMAGLFLFCSVPILKGAGDLITSLALFWVSAMLTAQCFYLYDLSAAWMSFKYGCRRSLFYHRPLKGKSAPSRKPAIVFLLLIAFTTVCGLSCTIGIHNEETHKAYEDLDRMVNGGEPRLKIAPQDAARAEHLSEQQKEELRSRKADVLNRMRSRKTGATVQVRKLLAYEADDDDEKCIDMSDVPSCQRCKNCKCTYLGLLTLWTVGILLAAHKPAADLARRIGLAKMPGFRCIILPTKNISGPTGV